MHTSVEIDHVVLEYNLFKSRQCAFSKWLFISPWKKALKLNKFESPLLYTEYFVSFSVETGPQVVEKIFKQYQYIFNLLLFPLLRKKGKPFILMKLNPSNTRMF